MNLAIDVVLSIKDCTEDNVQKVVDAIADALNNLDGTSDVEVQISDKW